MEDVKKKAIIYSRVSTENQDYTRQYNDLIECAKYKKFEIVKVFQEKISGSTKTSTRLEFSSLLSYLEENQDVKDIFVWELSRIGRNFANVIYTINELTEKGINLHFQKEGYSTLNSDGTKNSMVNLITGMLSGFAEIELETTKARIKSGLRQSKKEGGANGSIYMPYGYKNENKKIVINESEIETVKSIFKLFISGYGTQKIAKHLNSNDIKSKTGKTWSDQSIYRILKNPIATGKRKHKSEIFKFEHLRIISDLEFDKVQTILKEKYNKQGINTKFDNLLKGKIICGECGLGYFQHKRISGKDNAYKCLSKRYAYKSNDKKTCDNPSIGIDKLNDAILFYLKRSKLVNLSEINTDLLEKSQEKLINYNSELDINKKELEKANNQRSELVRMKLNGIINESDYIKEYSNLNNLVTKLERNLNIINTKIYDLKQLSENIKKNKAIVNSQNLQEIIENFVDEIIINKIDFANSSQSEIESENDRLMTEQLKGALNKRQIKSDIENTVELNTDFNSVENKATIEKLKKILTNKQDVPVKIQINFKNSYVLHFIITQRTDKRILIKSHYKLFSSTLKSGL